MNARPKRIPAALKAVLLQELERINHEEGLGLAKNELLEHHKTRAWRVTIERAYAAGMHATQNAPRTDLSVGRSA